MEQPAKQSIKLYSFCQDPHYLALILSSLISPVFFGGFHVTHRLFAYMLIYQEGLLRVSDRDNKPEYYFSVNICCVIREQSKRLFFVI